MPHWEVLAALFLSSRCRRPSLHPGAGREPTPPRPPTPAPRLHPGAGVCPQVARGERRRAAAARAHTRRRRRRQVSVQGRRSGGRSERAPARAAEGQRCRRAPLRRPVLCGTRDGGRATGPHLESCKLRTRAALAARGALNLFHGVISVRRRPCGAFQHRHAGRCPNLWHLLWRELGRPPAPACMHRSRACITCASPAFVSAPGEALWHTV